MPPSGVKESCIAFTAPQEAAVVIGGEQRRGGDAEARFLAFHVAARLQRRSRLVDAERGELRIALLLERRSRRSTATTNITAIAASTAQPWRMVADHAAEGEAQRRRDQRRSTASATKLDSGVGFSYGCAELALKKPPPLVPSILIASARRPGPSAGSAVSVLLSSITGSPLASFSGWPSAPSLGSW